MNQNFFIIINLIFYIFVMSKFYDRYRDLFLDNNKTKIKNRFHLRTEGNYSGNFQCEENNNKKSNLQIYNHHKSIILENNATNKQFRQEILPKLEQWNNKNQQIHQYDNNFLIFKSNHPFLKNQQHSFRNNQEYLPHLNQNSIKDVEPKLQPKQKPITRVRKYWSTEPRKTQIKDIIQMRFLNEEQFKKHQQDIVSKNGKYKTQDQKIRQQILPDNLRPIQSTKNKPVKKFLTINPEQLATGILIWDKDINQNKFVEQRLNSIKKINKYYPSKYLNGYSKALKRRNQIKHLSEMRKNKLKEIIILDKQQYWSKKGNIF